MDECESVAVADGSGWWMALSDHWNHSHYHCPLLPIKTEQDPEDADYGDGSRASLVELDDDAYGGDGSAAPMEPSMYVRLAPAVFRIWVAWF